MVYAEPGAPLLPLPSLGAPPIPPRGLSVTTTRDGVPGPAGAPSSAARVACEPDIFRVRGP